MRKKTLVPAPGIPVIGEKADFYGWVIGLQLEREPNSGFDTPVPNKMYAIFERGNHAFVCRVPDFELFKLLSEVLCGNAFERSNCDCPGVGKVWIQKLNGKWDVQEP